MNTTPPFLVVVAITLSIALLLGEPKISVTADQTVESRDAKATRGSLQAQIVAKEREGLDALKAGNVERFASLTADDAVLVDAHGPASKAQVVTNVAAFTLTDYSMEDVRFVPLSANSGLITYKINEKGVSHGKEFAAQAYVSSIWAQRGTGWVCLFSQETAAR
jgi:ketosteroid isomerase-like protein